MLKMKTAKAFKIFVILAIFAMQTKVKNFNKYFVKQNIVKAMESAQDTTLNNDFMKSKDKISIYFEDKTFVEVYMPNFFYNKFEEPTEALTGFKKDDLLTREAILNFICEILKKSRYATGDRMGKLASFVFEFVKKYGFIKTCTDSYNNLLPTLQKDISEINDDDKEKIKDCCEKISFLRDKLKKIIEKTDSFIRDKSISKDYVQYARSINLYSKQCCRAFHVLLKVISIKFPTIFDTKNVNNLQSEIENLKKYITLSGYYQNANVEKMPLGYETKSKMLGCIDNLKNCLYSLDRCQYEYKVEGFEDFRKKFSKNLYLMEQLLNSTYIDEKILYELYFGKNEFSLPNFSKKISLKSGNEVEFLFDINQINADFKSFFNKEYMSGRCGHILKLLNSIFVTMKYIMQWDDFNNLINLVFSANYSFKEIDYGLYNEYFKSIFDEIFNKTIELIRARILNLINFSFKCYFSNLSDIVKDFLNYLKINTSNFYALYSNFESKDLKLQDKKITEYNKHIINNFELFLYFCNNTSVKEKLINKLKYNLEMWQKEDNKNVDLGQCLSLYERMKILEYIELKLSASASDSGYSEYKYVINKYVKYMGYLLEKNNIEEDIIGWNKYTKFEDEAKNTIKVMDEFEKFISGLVNSVGDGNASNEISFFERFLIKNIEAMFGLKLSEKQV